MNKIDLENLNNMIDKSRKISSAIDFCNGERANHSLG